MNNLSKSKSRIAIYSVAEIYAFYQLINTTMLAATIIWGVAVVLAGIVLFKLIKDELNS